MFKLKYLFIAIKHKLFSIYKNDLFNFLENRLIHHYYVKRWVKS